MPCKSTTELIQQYGPNWQNSVTIYGGAYNTIQLCQQGCCDQYVLRMSEYRLSEAGSGSPWTLTEGLCCVTGFDGPQECDPTRPPSGYGRSITIGNFRCDLGILKCDWSLYCVTADVQLTALSGTAEIQFSNDAPSGLTNVVTTVQNYNPFLQDCPLDDPSKCDSTSISQLSIVHV